MTRRSLSPGLRVLPSSTRARSRPLSNPGPSESTARRGVFMVVVMICLLVGSLIVGALLKLALLQSRQLVQEQARVQAEWLADSGLARAASQLAGDSDYAGETWTIPAADLAGHDGARVDIRVEKDPQQPQNRTVKIEAVYPAEGPNQVKRQLAATVTVSQES